MADETKTVSDNCYCPETYPDWHLQDIDLSGLPNHTVKIAAFFFMPLAYDSYAQRQQLDIERLEIQEQWPGLILTRIKFLGGTIQRLLDSGEYPSRFIRYFNSPFHVHGYLHEGGIGTIKDAVRALQNRLFDQGRMPKELYLCYLTCPICSDRKGGDKILLLRRYTESKTLQKRLSNRR